MPNTVAAGILLLTPDNQALFLQRGPSGDAPGMWCTPGGKIEAGETAIQAAIRECAEEAGYEAEESDLTLHTRQASTIPAPLVVVEIEPTDSGNAAPPGVEPASVDFTTFLARVPAPFPVVADDEHTGWAWAPIDNPPQPLHPGVSIALARLNMDELGIARAMAASELTSPQTYHNVTLWAMRITGTGVSYRPSLDEFVYRPPEDYLNPDFLARCSGLAAIVEHPPNATMDSKEFGARVVGAVMLPYIKADEVWGIVKVYDDETNKALHDEEASTSPTVVLRKGGSTSMTLDDGSRLLIEGKPALIDHVALLPRGGKGVWDKGGEATGVDRAGVEARADSLDPHKLRRLSRGLTLLNVQMSNRLARA